MRSRGGGGGGLARDGSEYRSTDRVDKNTPHGKTHSARLGPSCGFFWGGVFFGGVFLVGDLGNWPPGVQVTSPRFLCGVST